MNQKELNEIRRRFKLAALFGERRLIQTARADIERLGGTVAVVRGKGNERLVRGALRAVLIAEELGKVRVVIGGLVDGVERLLTDPQQAQLVLIGLFAAVVADVLGTLLGDLLPVGIGQRDAVLLRPLADDGIELGHLLRVGLDEVAEGHAVGILGVEVHAGIVRSQLVALRRQPVQILLRRDLFDVDGHDLRVRADAGHLIVKSVRAAALAVGGKGDDPHGQHGCKQHREKTFHGKPPFGVA